MVIVKRAIFGWALLCVVLALSALGSARAAGQQGCTLKEVGALPVSKAQNGLLTVPVNIEGHEQPMILPLMNFTVLSRNAFPDRDPDPVGPGLSGLTINFLGRKVDQHVRVRELALGREQGRDLKLAYTAEPLVPGTSGALGLDLLSNTDVELDLAGGKLNLFAQDHCPGTVVYWSGSFAVLPMRRDMVGHILLDMELDGKPIEAQLFLVDEDALMGTADAERIFGLTPQSAGMTSFQQDGESLYRYPFKTLSVGGLLVRNPHIVLFPQKKAHRCRTTHKLDPGESGCFGGADLVLGRDILRQLHLFIAFKEQKIYITAAAAPSQPSGGK